MRCSMCDKTRCKIDRVAHFWQFRNYVYTFCFENPRRPFGGPATVHGNSDALCLFSLTTDRGWSSARRRLALNERRCQIRCLVCCLILAVSRRIVNSGGRHFRNFLVSKMAGSHIATDPYKNRVFCIFLAVSKLFVFKMRCSMSDKTRCKIDRVAHFWQFRNYVYTFCFENAVLNIW